MKRFMIALVSAIAATLVLAGASASGLSPYVPGTIGVDVGWPNCGSTIPKATFGIVDVSGGTGYSLNPCLSQQAAKYQNNLSFYVNTGWNVNSSYINPASPKACTAGDTDCLAYNYGYNAGLYALRAASQVGASSTSWWLDVETDNTWNVSTLQNQNSLQGEYDALMGGGATSVGVYSTTAQWQTITGSWKNGWPSWGATTWRTASQARTYCSGHQFTGGPSVLMQYLPRRTNIDQDVAC